MRSSESEDRSKELERNVLDLKHELTSSEKRCDVLSAELEQASRFQDDLNSSRSIAEDLQRQLSTTERQRDDLMNSNGLLVSEVKALFEFKQSYLIRENDNTRALEAAQTLCVEHLNREREAQDSLHSIKIQFDIAKKTSNEQLIEISQLKSDLAAENEKNRTLEAQNTSIAQTLRTREKTIKKRTAELLELQHQFSDLRVREGILISENSQKDAAVAQLKTEYESAIISRDKTNISYNTALQDLQVINQHYSELEKSLQSSIVSNTELQTTVRSLEENILQMKEKIANMTDNNAVRMQLEDLKLNLMVRVDTAEKSIVNKDLHIADLRSCVDRAIISINECDDVICSVICHQDLSNTNNRHPSDEYVDSQPLNDNSEKTSTLEKLRIALSSLKIHVCELDSTTSALSHHVAGICKQFLRDRNLSGAFISDSHVNATSPTRNLTGDSEDSVVISDSTRFRQLVNMPLDAGSDLNTFCRVLAMDGIMHDQYRGGDGKRQLSTSSIGLKLLGSSLSEAFDWYISAQQCIQEENARRLELQTERQRALQV